MSITKLKIQDRLAISAGRWFRKGVVRRRRRIHIIFTLRYGLCPNITVDNIQIPSLDTVKYLGLNLDKI